MKGGRRDAATVAPAWRAKLLLESLASAGCPLPEERVYCSVCDEMAMGMYYSGEHKVCRRRCGPCAPLAAAKTAI